MSKDSIKIEGIIFCIVLGLFGLMMPIRSELIYTATLVKVEHSSLGPDYYYFDNGLVIGNLGSMKPVVMIGKTYNIFQWYSFFGVPTCKTAELIS